MAASNYPACLKFTLQFEGGYSNHPSDPAARQLQNPTNGLERAVCFSPVTLHEVRGSKAAQVRRINSVSCFWGL
jgi:lysozyme family protein